MKTSTLGIAVLLAQGASALTLPVAEVTLERDVAAKNCPATIVTVAEVQLQPQVSGEILEVAFKNGQRVREGDVLYRLDPVKYVAAEKNARAKVVECKSNLAYAEVATERHAELVKTRAVSQDEHDRAVSVRDSARAALAAAEADLAAAADDVKHCTIVAPISGRLGSTALTKGNYVTKGGAKLVTLVQTDPIRVRFQISSVDYAEIYGSSAERLVREASVAVRLVSGGDVAATGRVEYVENLADSATDSVEIYALLDNRDDRFLAGQTVMVMLENTGGVLRPSVPPNTLVQDMRGMFVWVVGADGKAEKRRVVRGRFDGRRQFVLAGLKAGERVVADGVHRVREGMAIEAEAAR